MKNYFILFIKNFFLAFLIGGFIYLPMLYFFVFWVLLKLGLLNAEWWAILFLLSALLLGVGFFTADELRSNAEKKHKEMLENVKAELQQDIKRREIELSQREINIKYEQERRANEIENRKQALLDLMDEFTQKQAAVYELIDSSSQKYPWLAKLYADYEYSTDKKISHRLKNKKNPAVKAAEQVSLIASEKREETKLRKMLEYQIAYWEALFPWLEDFKDVKPLLGAKYVYETDWQTDNVKDWLSPEEYAQLSPIERNQRALDRYKKRKKTDWEIGIEYERYIGYLLESDGYSVKYTGAIMGLEDMGRDLIAQKDNTICVVQCKRWSKEKTIHEKHIFQLYGTSVLMSINNSDAHVDALFVTTAKLSETAERCAQYLNVKVLNSYPMKEYPLIKCNVSKDGRKIYHLPFDQQYDKVRIKPNTEERYAETVAEAEAYGFRRAFKWKGNKGE